MAKLKQRYSPDDFDIDLRDRGYWFGVAVYSLKWFFIWSFRFALRAAAVLVFLTVCLGLAARKNAIKEQEQKWWWYNNKS